ncbi:MAG: sensor histidine kinase [Leptolyngbyaceae cyanobacterium]
MLCIDSLLALEPFQALPKERLQWICDRAQAYPLPKGEFLVKEGNQPKGFFILTEGRISLTRLSEGVDMPIGSSEAPAFMGEIQVLTEEPVPVSVRALSDCRLYQLSCTDFLELLHTCRIFERAIFREVQKRTRGLESFIRSREKMASLGTLSAGLAHELNNPAAAIVRALKDALPAMRKLEMMNLIYGQQLPEADYTEQWQQTREQGYDTLQGQRPDPMTLSDREDALLDWLEDFGIDDAWKLSEPLAAAGIEAKALAHLTDPWLDQPKELREMGIRWLALSFEVMEMMQSGLRGAERISELVNSMKSYSHMDAGAQQQVDIHDGLEDTLRLFAYKLKGGITVERHYARDLPQILAYGSELNQVWTNLIDNAIAAMAGQGKIILRTCRDGNYVRTEIEDTGPGIPEEIQLRIYEPFFTTKPMGEGSGLGLDVARRIVENRHQGMLSVESVPGKTCFTVCIPVSTEMRASV